MSCCDNKTPSGQEKSRREGWVTGPRRWMLLGAVVVAGGLALGWDQLVLLGIAPALVSLLPCLVMCGLGLCMMKKCQGNTGKPSDQGEATEMQARGKASAAVSAGATSATRQVADHNAPTEPPASKLQA